MVESVPVPEQMIRIDSWGNPMLIETTEQLPKVHAPVPDESEEEIVKNS